MTDRTIDLDLHRGMAAQKATELRRLLTDVETDQNALRVRQEELEAHLLASPLTGATDARFFRQAGIPAYGFGLLSRQITPAQYWSRFHGNDERIDVESLRLSADMWEQLALDFLT